MLFLIIKTTFIIVQSNNNTDWGNVLPVLKEAYFLGSQQLLFLESVKKSFCESGQIHLFGETVTLTIL